MFRRHAYFLGSLIGKYYPKGSLNFFFCMFSKKKKINQSRTATCRWGPQTVPKPPITDLYLVILESGF